MSQSPLYDRDFHAWANQQAALLETTDHATPRRANTRLSSSWLASSRFMATKPTASRAGILRASVHDPKPVSPVGSAMNTRDKRSQPI